MDNSRGDQRRKGEWKGYGKQHNLTPIQVQGETWILAAAYTLKDENGVVTDVLGALTDISRNKWAEAFLEKRMLEAVELKRQQEKFIVRTSSLSFAS